MDDERWYMVTDPNGWSNPDEPRDEFIKATSHGKAKSEYVQQYIDKGWAGHVYLTLRCRLVDMTYFEDAGMHLRYRPVNSVAEKQI